MIHNEDLLLAVLNSAPVVAGRPTDELSGPSRSEFARRFGGSGSDAEVERLSDAREALHAVVRGHDDAMDRLAPVMADAVLVPKVSATGIQWTVRAPEDATLAVRAVMAWAAVVEQLPGRLRACANDECNLFLLDRSRPGAAKWCSMATCGNRMKARAHATRVRSSPTDVL